MKKYKTLLFDVDDTLLDFAAAEDSALSKLFACQKIQLTPEIKTFYKKMNRAMWEDYEQGKLERDELVNTRFAKLFRRFGKLVDGMEMERDYRRYLQEGHQLIQGARQLIFDLNKTFDLYIVTNGVKETQYKRLSDSGLSPFFKRIFVSEETGYHKPDQRFFQYVFAHIPYFNKGGALIIGDSLISDILGGIRAGLDTCWFNAKNQHNELREQPTYTVQRLEEIRAVVDIG